VLHFALVQIELIELVTNYTQLSHLIIYSKKMKKGSKKSKQKKESVYDKYESEESQSPQLPEGDFLKRLFSESALFFHEIYLENLMFATYAHPDVPSIIDELGWQTMSDPDRPLDYSIVTHPLQLVTHKGLDPNNHEDMFRKLPPEEQKRLTTFYSNSTNISAWDSIMSRKPNFLQSEYYTVKESTIEGAGYGLFFTPKQKKMTITTGKEENDNFVLGIYPGAYIRANISQNCDFNDDGVGSYLIGTIRTENGQTVQYELAPYVIDGKLYNETLKAHTKLKYVSPMQFINQSFEKDKINVKFISGFHLPSPSFGTTFELQECVLIVVKKNTKITYGQELFVDYGYEYWKSKGYSHLSEKQWKDYFDGNGPSPFK
jgi:hypothetical protein